MNDGFVTNSPAPTEPIIICTAVPWKKTSGNFSHAKKIFPGFFYANNYLPKIFWSSVLLSNQFPQFRTRPYRLSNSTKGKAP
jgi:hypothetical protein